MTAAKAMVSLIVPVRNEADHIDRCLAALVAQTYPSDLLEIIVVDGASTDATVGRVRGWIERDSRIRLVENPARVMPVGLNLGIEAARGSVVGVISGHSMVGPDYVDRAVMALSSTGAASVGGRIVRKAVTPWQRAIAAATSSPVGVGDARHNYARTAGWVETVFPGMWPRDVIDRVGLFDPAMVSNEDNEFSLRIRKSGGAIWYDPAIEVEYVPRASVRGLFEQYRRYGFGKVAVLRKHRGGWAWRQLVPPLWVLYLSVGGLLAIALPALRPWWLAGVAVYAIVVAVEAVRLCGITTATLRTVVAIATLHLAYGLGILQGLLSTMRTAGRRASR